MSEMVVSVTGLNKNYDGFSLSNVSFDVKKGSIMAVLGNKGAGKTQILDAILNIIDIDGGKIKLFGCNVNKADNQMKQDIAVIYGDYHFDAGMTVTGLNPIFKNIYKNWSQETYFAYLERMGILPNTDIALLPSGTNIMIQMAVALAHESKLIIIDEPIRDMDNIYVPKLKELFAEYVKDKENSILYFSRNVSELDELANSITILDKGKVLLTGKKDKILNTHGIIYYVKGKPFRMDASLIAGFVKSSTGAVVLINDRKLCGAKYPNIEISQATLEDVMKYYIVDNNNKS